MNSHQWREIVTELKISQDQQKNLAILRENGMSDAVNTMNGKRGMAWSPIMLNGWPAIVSIHHFKNLRVYIYAIPPKYLHVSGEFFAELMLRVTGAISQALGEVPSTDVIGFKDNPRFNPELN